MKQKVLITGATGLVGKEIVKLCHAQNIAVHYLTRSKSKIETKDNYKGFYWDYKKREIDSTCFEGVDTIIYLAGATVSKRWTPTYKNEIIESRVETTKFLLESLKDQNHNVQQLIAASAIGIYPDSITNYYDAETTEVSSSFLGQVVQQWEAAVDAFTALNIKVAKVRIGLVLSQKGGALAQIVKPVKLGFGAAFGSGKQWQSWIHIQDLSRIFMFVMQHRLEGIYNGVAPNPVTNTELIKSIANALNRPYFLPNFPKRLMCIFLGEMHSLLFESQRVSSKKMEMSGFEFKYHHLQPALQDLF